MAKNWPYVKNLKCSIIKRDLSLSVVFKENVILFVAKSTKR